MVPADRYHSLVSLPSGAELPDSDDTPVDNEDQNLLLYQVQLEIWSFPTGKTPLLDLGKV